MIWPGAKLPAKIITALQNRVRKTPANSIASNPNADDAIIAEMVNALSADPPGSTADALAMLRKLYPYHPLEVRLTAIASLKGNTPQ